MATAAVSPQGIKPDQATMAAFGVVVLIAGSNAVAVRLSNQELPPFFGAGIRFAAAAMLLLLIVRWRKIPSPGGLR